MLCQKELAAFAGHAEGDVVVACTQEARLFGDVAEEGGKTQTIRFVNIRETGGWSNEAKAATPKIAALLALAGLPEPDPVPRVAYRSEGQLLIVGPADAALHWAHALSAHLAVTVLVTGRASGMDLPAERAFPVHSGKLTALAGWLGAFDVAWAQENPIDLDLCTRCNACVRACPEHAIDLSYQIDSTAAARTASASPRAVRRRRSTSSAATSTRSETFRPRARPAAHATAAHAPAAAGLFRAGRRRTRAGAGGRRARDDDRRVREAQVLRVQGVDLRAQPVAEAGLQSMHRRLLDRGDSPPTAITSKSSRTCAWAAALARRSVRRAR